MNYKVWCIAVALWKFKFLEQISQTLLAYGWVGVFSISLLDSAFIPMPSGPDLLLVLGLSFQNSPIRIITYVLAATLGSTIGCTVLYLIARRAGEVALKPVSAERREYIQGLLGRYDALALVVASIMPPPFPFKPFILSAGVFKFKLPRLIVALIVGRTLRYSVLAMLALYFGKATVDLIAKYGPQLLIVLVAIGVLIFAFRYFRINHKDTEITKS